MISSIRILNWAISGVIALDLFAKASITKAEPSLHMAFVLAPLVLLTWQVMILAARLQDQSGDPTASPHERIEPGDWWRLFFILWGGHRSLASDFLWGFYIYSLIAAGLLIVLAFSASVEFYKKRAISQLAIGCIVFAYFLLAWEKNMYVIHYGVPIIDHFFEKPEYDAKYRVTISQSYSENKYNAIADIYVKGRTETEDYGEEDIFGQSIIYSYNYRDIWVKRLQFPNGGSVKIVDQPEALHMGDTTLVTDANGQTWHVKLLNQPIL